MSVTPSSVSLPSLEGDMAMMEAAENLASLSSSLQTSSHNASEPQKFVSFYLDNEFMSCPMSNVREIIRVPHFVPVPLSNHSLLGLANLRGTVLPLLSLRRLLELEDIAQTDASRIIVVDVGRTIGVLVDRVASVLNVEPQQIESSHSMQSVANLDALSGVVKNVAGQSLMSILNIHDVIHNEFDMAGFESVTAGHSGHQSIPSSVAEQNAEEETIQLVSFVVNSQEYAFPIESVEEIVRIPDSISHVPSENPSFLGMINLRNRVLPLIGLREIFHMTPEALTDHHRVVVLRLSEGDSSGRVGIVVDQVSEVLRVSKNDQQAVPALIENNQSVHHFTSICRLNNGKRLVTTVNVGALCHHPATQEALEHHQQHDQGADTMMHQTHKEEDIQLVVFKLNNEEFSFPIHIVREIIRIPEQLSRMPKTPSFIQGLVNLRGSVLPVIDFRERLGLDKATCDDHQRIVVLGVNGTQTGFIVDSVTEVLRLPAHKLEPAPHLSGEQSHLMKQVVNLPEKKRMILLVDSDALLGSEEQEALKNMDSPSLM